MRSSRRRFLEALLTLPVVVPAALSGGCTTSSRSSAATKGTGALVRIGYQKGGALNLLRLRGTLEPHLAQQGTTVQWLNFPAGPQLVEALGVGSIDLGLTGDSPAIFGQAKGTPLVYVANAPAAPDGSGDGILVPRNSPLKSVAELKGKRVAFQRGSSAHHVVIQILEKNGLQYKDIRPIFLAPPEARPAFESGAVDAWAVWDPFLTVARAESGGRILSDAHGVETPGGFYLASPEFARTQPARLRTVLEEAAAVCDWAKQNPREAAELLAPTVGVKVDILTEVTRRGRGLGLLPIDDAVLDAQQKVADDFVRVGLLPQKVDVRQATLTPEQYAAIKPEKAPAPAVKTASAGETRP